MSNIQSVSPLALSARVSIPAEIERGKAAAELVAALCASPAAAFSAASKTAAHDAFVMTCAGLAIAQAAFGDSSRLQRFRTYAETLKDSKGKIPGPVAKMLAGFSQAVEFGKVFAGQLDKAAAIIPLSGLASSPSFGALIAAPAAKKAESAPATAPAAKKAESAPAAAPVWNGGPAMAPCDYSQDGKIGAGAEFDLVGAVLNSRHDAAMAAAAAAAAAAQAATAAAADKAAAASAGLRTMQAENAALRALLAEIAGAGNIKQVRALLAAAGLAAAA